MTFKSWILIVINGLDLDIKQENAFLDSTLVREMHRVEYLVDGTSNVMDGNSNFIDRGN